MTGLFGDRDAGSVLFLHAHPDDETIATGGTIARLVETGCRVTVLTATRGERGEVVPGVGPVGPSPEQLVELRLAELGAALRELGVTHHQLLGTPPARAAGAEPRRYTDSGMQWGAGGWAVPADDVSDGALSLADDDELVADLLAAIAAAAPDLVVGYDERGGYGHPDHVAVHRAGRAAAARAGITFAEVLPGPDEGEHTPDSRQRLDELLRDGGGVVRVDVTGQRERVLAALRCHASQLEHVAADHIVHVGGQRQELPDAEWFRIR